MRVSPELSYVFCGAAALAMFAPTSAMSTGRHHLVSPSNVPAQTMQAHVWARPLQSFVSPGVDGPGGAHAFISFNSYNSSGYVVIYDIEGRATATLTGFSQPEGLTVDRSGKLYVSDEYNARVQVYAKGYRGKPTTLNDPDQHPDDVVVDADGNVAVTSLSSSSGGPGDVRFYAKGATNPTRTIWTAPFASLDSCAFDAQGNLYVDGTDANLKPVVGIVAGGINGTKIALLRTENALGVPTGVGVTTKGQIAIYTYRPPNPKTGSLGRPIFTTPLTGASTPVDFAFSPTDSSAVVVDTQTARAEEFAYPAGGSPLRTLFVGGVPVGVALYPPQSP